MAEMIIMSKILILVGKNVSLFSTTRTDVVFSDIYNFNKAKEYNLVDIEKRRTDIFRLYKETVEGR